METTEITRMKDISLLPERQQRRFLLSLRILRNSEIDIQQNRQYWHNVALNFGPKVVFMLCTMLKTQLRNQYWQKIKRQLLQDLREARVSPSMSAEDLLRAARGEFITRDYQKFCFLINSKRSKNARIHTI